MDDAAMVEQALLPAQDMLWTADRLRGSADASLRADLLRIPGPLDHDLFRQALTRAVAEAEALHCHVALRDRRPVLVRGTPIFACPLIDLSAAPDPHRAAQDWFENETRSPVDPADPAPARFALLRLAPALHYWARFVTQVAADAPSRAALARRTRAHLDALSAGAPPPPPPAAHAECARAFAQTQSARAAGEHHWRVRLAALPPLLWPAAAPPECCASRTVQLADTGGLRAIAARAATTLPRLALAAAARALGAHFGRASVVLGVQVDLRGPARFRDTIGSFALALPLVADALHTHLPALAATYGARLAADWRHARTPLRGLSARPPGVAQFDAVFNYLPATDAGGWEEVARHHGPAVPLMLLLRERGAALEITLDHDPALLPAEAAGRLLAAILAELAAPETQPAPSIDLAPTAALAAIAAARVQDRLGETIVVGTPEGPHACTIDAATPLGLLLQAATPADPTVPPDLTLHFDSTGEPRLAFPPDTQAPVCRGIAEAFAILRTDAPATRATPAAALRILAPATAAALLEQARGPARPLPDLATLPALIAAQAARTPSAIAVQDAAEALDYQTLATRAEALAGRLAAAGIARGAVVAVRLARTATLVAALLAIHRLGAAFLPLDPTHPAARQCQSLDYAGATLLLTDAPAGLGIAELRLDLPGPAIPIPSAPQAQPDDTAYILFTSGSTGRPKGVAVSQRSLANHALHSAGMLGADACAGMLFTTALTFDVSLLELFAPLVCGGRVLIAESLPAAAHSPLRTEARTLSASPSILAATFRAHGLPPQVTTVVTIGEALPRDLADRLLAARPDLRLVNAYGPTEATIHVTETVIGAGQGASPIGRPIANTAIHILDRHGALLPPGVEGELCIAGPCVAQGYVGRPDLTAERFRPDPFAATPDARLYRTGDRARWREDGQLDFLGRRDAQIKLNGLRLEPAEIEAALAAQPGIAAAAVGLHEGRLVAWLAPASAPPDEPLRAALAAHLPRAMIPAAFLRLPALPLTASGKLDRAALPPPAPAEPDAHRPPESAAEHAMLRLFQDVLDLPAIRAGTFGADQPLSDLGVDSLATVLLCAEIEAVHGLRVPPALIESRPSLATLAAFVEGASLGPHLLVDGRVILPRPGPPDRLVFDLVLPIAELRIVSACATPRAVNGTADDRRLGLLLNALAWEQDDRNHPVALDQPFLGEGFHGPEAGATGRWTDGHAFLATDLQPPWQGPTRLVAACWNWLEASPSPPTVVDARAPDWLAGFESLGATCEFGFVLRGTGARVPPGLLRWAGIEIDRLLAGLAENFSALDDPAAIHVQPSDTDWRLVTPYGRMHTFQPMAAVGAERTEAIRRRAAAALLFLRRQLLEDLRTGAKIFVYAVPWSEFPESRMRQLKAALERHGPAPLLCVNLADANHPPAPPRRLAPGLYAATLARIASMHGPYDEWLALCRATLTLRDEDARR